MKKVLLILFIIPVAFVYGQTKTEYYESGKKKFEGSYKYTGTDPTSLYNYSIFDYYKLLQMTTTLPLKLYDGFCKTWFENGTLQMTGTYSLGFPDGNFTYYYDNGNKKAEGEYKLGLKSGLWTEWYENGNRKQIGTYSLFTEKEIDSLYVLQDKLLEVYKSDKDIAQEIPDMYKHDLKFDPLSKKDGKFTVFYEDGTLEADCFFSNNIENGEWKFYFPNGKLERTLVYKEGECNGVSSTYAVSGLKLSEINICKGKNTVINIWDKNANQLVKDGNGKFIDYSEDGKKVMEGNYKDGKKDGIWTNYRLDSSIELVSNYQQGKLLTEKEYGYNSELQEERVYKNDKLILTRTFSNGKMVDERKEEY